MVFGFTRDTKINANDFFFERTAVIQVHILPPNVNVYCLILLYCKAIYKILEKVIKRYIA